MIAYNQIWPRRTSGSAPAYKAGVVLIGGDYVAQFVDADQQRKLTWIQRLARKIAQLWQPPDIERTTVLGISQAKIDALTSHFFDVGGDRKDVYADMDVMDDTVDEFARALTVLADHAMAAEFGDASFHVAMVSGDQLPSLDQKIIEALMARVRMEENLFHWTRHSLKYGDLFLERVIGRDDRLIHRLATLPPESMVRNEDRYGLLQNEPNPEDGTGYAFTQVFPGSGTPSAQFLPIQIEHVRWLQRGAEKYGRAHGYTARVAWRKIQALEEALVMNWLTRAFARLLFIIDTTGLTPSEAEDRISEFQKRLQTTDVGSGELGVQNMSIVKDVFVGKQFASDDRGEIQPDNTNVKVLDTTSSAFWNMDPIEHYQNKIVTSMGVPKGYLGIERDINAKATLTVQDRAFARTVRMIQQVMGRMILHTVEVQYALLGRPMPQLKVEWPQQYWQDEVDHSQAIKNYSDAAEKMLPLGIIDNEFVWRNFMHLPPSETAALRRRVPETPPVMEPQNPQEKP